MNMEIFTPKTPGFLSNVKRLRVSRDLIKSRKAYEMTKRLIFLYSLYRVCGDRGVTLPPSDGIDG